MYRFVSQGGPDTKAPDVSFIRSFPDYPQALEASAQLDSDRKPELVSVIYRISIHKGKVYASRQLDPRNSGQELHCEEPDSSFIGYDLFTAPQSLLSARLAAPPEYALVKAINDIYDFSQQLRPGKGGP